MAIVIANHKVKNFAKWKPFYDADAKRRKNSGIKELAMGRKADDLNNVYFIWEIKDLNKFKAMSKDPELQEIIKKAGVISKLNMIALRKI